LRITTKNITSLTVTQPWEKDPGAVYIMINGQKVTAPILPADVHRADGVWQLGQPDGLRKIPGLQGPIDDVFLGPFLVVLPSGKSKDAPVQEWVDFELAHFTSRWRALFRGDVRSKSDTEVTAADLENYHLILWGDPESNKLIAPALAEISDLSWPAEKAQVLAGIYPNPKNPKRYVVFNSGPTFRENHDKTNSTQNPKLPDWAIIDITTPPNGSAPGKIIDAGFFNEQWKK
jgi:hypothetical protein